ncbi:hypothetical protein WMY93_024896 [Mugilogobius chulae]|uniref:Uncharacterized protein n=1 Tax=Mugilogobius chulae TaxID=88201 RepID=A0AAW0N7Q4_9GOBI
MPGILLGDVFPNFEADTTIGKIKFHDFLGDSWGILFSHPETSLLCAPQNWPVLLKSPMSLRNVSQDDRSLCGLSGGPSRVEQGRNGL